MAHKDLISLLIPVYNEVENVDLMVGKLISVLNQLRSEISDFEIIFVDDGSNDGTRERLKTIVEVNDRVKVILLRKNFGKSAALAAGFLEASGEIIITMDGDLQDEPEEIPNLIKLIDQGYDLVSGWKKVRNDPFEKRAFSKLFNLLVSRLTGVHLHDFNCGFKAYRSWCVKKITLSGNLYRFLPVFVARQGGKIVELPVRHNKRIYGKSKFGASRYFHGFFDLITITMLTHFFFKPMYFFGAIALALLGIAGSIGSYLFARHLIWVFSGDLTYQLNNRPLLTIGFALAGLGLNILLVGALAELMLQLSPSKESSYFYSVESVFGGKTREHRNDHKL